MNSTYTRILICLFPLGLFAQNSSYYINWNVDYTERSVRPSIPITTKEAKEINCYSVTFDNQSRLEKVEYFFSGKESKHSDYGAFQFVRKYSHSRYEDTFFNEDGEQVENTNGVYKIVYHLNDKGYWIKKEFFGRNNQLIEIEGKSLQPAAISIVTRDLSNRIKTEITLDANYDTIPDINGFKVVSFGFNKDGYISFRKSTDSEGQLVNGKMGYAIVNFQCDHNGVFFEEEFRDENLNLVKHPRLLFARVNFREFNKYGKYRKVYYIDSNGYPDENRAYATIEYSKNMSISSGTFFDRNGMKTEDPRGIASFTFDYTPEGEPLGRTNFNLNGEEIN